MKKISILSVVILLLNLAVSANTETIIYSEAFSANNLQEITIPIYIKNNPGVFYFNIDLYYDNEYLTFVDDSLLNGNIVTSSIVVNPMYNENAVRFVTSNALNFYGDGMLFSFKFKIKDNLLNDINTLIEIRVNNLMHLENNSELIDLEYSVENINIDINKTIGLPKSMKPDNIAKTDHYVPVNYNTL